MADKFSLSRLVDAWRRGGKELAQGYPSPSTLSPWWFMPAGHVDTSSVGDGTGNSIVEGALRVITNGFAEPPAVVVDDLSGQEEPIPGHSLAQLLAQPNPYMVGELLWKWTVASTHAAGDAYWVKARSMSGQVRELWPIMPDMMEPMDATGPHATPEERAAHQAGQGPFIAYYQYTVNGRRHRLETTDVVHLRDEMDPDNPRKGKSPLKTVLREILADEEAGQFAAAMLKNRGVPGVILTPDVDDPSDGPTGDDADDIAEKFEQKFGGSNRGRVMVTSGGRWKVNVISFSPQEMNFRDLRRVPEERVTSVLGVPAILAQLGAGLERAINANAKELREFFTEQKLGPMWRLYAALVTMQLGPDFNLPATQRVVFDLGLVRALQQDEDALWKRWLEAVRAGAVTVADFKRAVGLDPSEADEVYLRPTTVVEVPFDEQLDPTRMIEATVAGSEG